MICPVCFGRKYDFKKDGNSGYFVECKKCHGTGIVEPLTNEEWFCGLSTEEKVTALLNLREHIRQKMRAELGSENKFHKGDYYREWLKEKHREERKK